MITVVSGAADVELFFVAVLLLSDLASADLDRLLFNMISSRLILLTLAIGATVTTAASQQDDSDDGGSGSTTLVLEHSLDGGYSYSARGTIVMETTRSGGVVVTSDEQADVSPDQISALNELCDTAGLYLLKASTQAGIVHRTVADPCMLVASKLNDVLVIHVDWKTQMVGLSMSPPKNTRSASGVPRSFVSKVQLQQMESGPSPDTSAFIQKMEQENLSKQRGETKDNRSFFTKYWMYIIPVVLVLAMSSGGGDGGGGGGR
jgi:hypothetical protein